MVNSVTLNKHNKLVWVPIFYHHPRVKDKLLTIYEIWQLQKEHKLKVFAGARVCFVGFPEDETLHMSEVLASNGGGTCQLDDPDCTHVVSIV